MLKSPMSQRDHNHIIDAAMEAFSVGPRRDAQKI